MLITWASEESQAAGVRCGERVGQGLCSTGDLLEFARRVTWAVETGEEQHYCSAIGDVLVMPDGIGAIAYLQPFDLDRELDDSPAEVSELRA